MENTAVIGHKTGADAVLGREAGSREDGGRVRQLSKGSWEKMSENDPRGGGTKGTQ